MSHSFTKIWIHGVFSTKDRVCLIKSSFESLIHRHIKDHLEENLGCKVRIINGCEDHIHILFLMNPGLSIQDTFKNIKGESSHWINQSNFINEKFSWQTGYGAFSVSDSSVAVVEEYIKNQKSHHTKMSFEEESGIYAKKCGLII